jgi:hypothetical protein
MLFVLAESSFRQESDGRLIGAMFAIPILAIGGWSLFAIVRVVRRNAFGPASEGATKT